MTKLPPHIMDEIMNTFEENRRKRAAMVAALRALIKPIDESNVHPWKHRGHTDMEQWRRNVYAFLDELEADGAPITRRLFDPFRNPAVPGMIHNGYMGISEEQYRAIYTLIFG